MIMRIRAKKQGGHYHCRVFTSPGIDETFAKCGDLVFDERDWKELQSMLRNTEIFLEPEPITA